MTRPNSGRALAEIFLWSMSSAGVPVAPQPPEGVTTSFARRYSQLTGCKMRRTSPHPRPWEGPIIIWDAQPFFDVDRAEVLGGTWSNRFVG